MKVYVLNLGWLECDKNQMVALSTVGTRSQPFVTNQWIQVPIMAVLIDHPDGKILYDTGCHPQAMSGYWPQSLQDSFPFYQREDQDLTRQLALCGLQPADIDTVVISHLHLDHAGNLHLFKHARVYVSDEDFHYAQTLVRLNPDPATHGAYIKAELDVTVRQYHLVSQDCQLLPGVDLITLPGHTPGLLGLVLHLAKDQILIFPQDCLYTQENYGPPARASSLVYDSLAFFRSIEKVRRLASQYQAQVMFAHDMDFFQTIRHAPAFYE